MKFWVRSNVSPASIAVNKRSRGARRLCTCRCFDVRVSNGCEEEDGDDCESEDMYTSLLTKACNVASLPLAAVTVCTEERKRKRKRKRRAFATLLLILTSFLALSAENHDTLREVLKRLLSL